MEQQRRLLLFFSLSLAIMLGWSQFIVPMLMPPVPRGAEVAEAPVSALAPENPPSALAEQRDAPAGKKIAKFPEKSTKLGSLDPESGYFLEVELTSRGAAVTSIRLNDPRYPELGARGTPLTLVGHDLSRPQKTFALQLEAIDRLLDGWTLETVDWELVESSASSATFRYPAPDGSLEAFKTYSLVPVQPQQGTISNVERDSQAQGYQLKLAVKIANRGEQPASVKYTLRGPVGLPLEDPHNSAKYNDVRLGFLREGGGIDHSTILASDVVDQEREAFAGKEVNLAAIETWKRPLQYIGVDTQYFAALIHPEGDQLKTPTVDSSQAYVVNWRGKDEHADVSVLLTSRERAIPARGVDGSPSTFEDSYLLYAGPKREQLLASIKAESVLDYGWFAPLVRLMLTIVSSLYGMRLGYGLAIIGLTCLVRAAMIPLTMHQARSMEKMKELQPKIKSLHEKYKKDPNSLTPEEMRQMQEVNLKMFAGCLPLFLQMPIFIALYRALQVSVDLRMAPFHLFGNWIDNLASPDALFAFGFTIPLAGWTEFNLLPLLSIVLMQVNQKLTMPPPADEEQAMQYRMMNIMMYVMVVFFYRVPAGLCLYFIVSSIWGTTERLIMKRLTPPAQPTVAGASTGVTAVTAAGTSTSKTEHKPATTAKPSLFDGMRAKLKELQELADKEAAARRDQQSSSGNGKSRKNRGGR